MLIKLEDDIYGGHLNIVVGPWEEFCDAHAARYPKGMSGLPYPREGSVETEHMGGYHMNLFGLEKGRDPFCDNMIWVNGKLDEVDVVSCLAHEILHAALLLMEMIGVRCDKEGNHEVITYWHTWAMRSCLLAMGKGKAVEEVQKDPLKRPRRRCR